MNWTIQPFYALSHDNLYDLIALRIDVFVVEQNCPYPELDGKDKKALHVFARNESGQMVATSRILPPGVSYDEVSIGRVCSALSVRKSGAGRALMHETMEAIKKTFGSVPVRISAQEYLVKFYSSFGFEVVSEMYLEDDIPHVEMLYTP